MKYEIGKDFYPFANIKRPVTQYFLDRQFDLVSGERCKVSLALRPGVADVFPTEYMIANFSNEVILNPEDGLYSLGAIIWLPHFRIPYQLPRLCVVTVAEVELQGGAESVWIEATQRRRGYSFDKFKLGSGLEKDLLMDPTPFNLSLLKIRFDDVQPFPALK